MDENPGPAMQHVDPNKTIKDPHKKADVVFWQNARQKFVAMSLCALIYHNMKGISNPGDLKQIVRIDNQLYSSLSKLKQDNHSYCLQNYQQCLQYCREITS